MNQGTVLVVEDDPALREVLCETLQLAQYSVETANNGQDALRRLSKNNEIGLILSDVQMQPLDGNALLKSVRSQYPELSVILMTAFGTVEKAVQAMQEGAMDYLVKPFEAQALVEMVSRFIVARNGAVNDDHIAVDPQSQELTSVARRVALTSTTVMISGESGVGKEVIARFIHNHSSRSMEPFVAINCAAIPENMLEAVLFGYEKGAFTGAHQSRAGKFEQAQGGTLLLDEITEMDFGLQAKLLRVLQEREVERLGGNKMIPLDVRILATTNRDIHQTVAEGQFREDLFYRLNVFPLKVLPLRQRSGDILPLARQLLSACDGGAGISLSDSAAAVLMEHNWPGNVRELDNVIQRANIMRSGNVIEACDISFETISDFEHTAETSAVTADATADRADDTAAGGLNKGLKDHEKNLIISALRAMNSRREVAEKLGISPRTLRYKLAKLRDAGITIPV